MYFFHTLFICSVFGLTVFQNTIADKICNTSKCTGPQRYYRSLECKPIFKFENDCCAYRYDCSHLENRLPQKCYIHGYEYNLNEPINKAHIGGRCDFGCVCTEDYEGLATVSCFIADFAAPALEKPNCYHRRDAVCGLIEAICPENSEDRPTCQVDGKTYLDGEQFEPASEPYKTCYCHPEYKGENIEPFCAGLPSKHLCQTEVFHGVEIYKKCAPIEYDSVHANCTLDFLCPSSEDSILPTDLVDTATDETCEYGNLILKKGAKFKIGSSLNRSANCICEVGPTPTCKYAF